MTDVRLIGVKPASINAAFWSYTSDAKTGIYRPYTKFRSRRTSFPSRRTYTVRLSSHMESIAFELAEMLEKQRNKDSNVLSSFFSSTLIKEVITSNTEYVCWDSRPPLHTLHTKSQHRLVGLWRIRWHSRSTNVGWILSRLQYQFDTVLNGEKNAWDVIAMHYNTLAHLVPWKVLVLTSILGHHSSIRWHHLSLGCFCSRRSKRTDALLGCRYSLCTRYKLPELSDTALLG